MPVGLASHVYWWGQKFWGRGLWARVLSLKWVSTKYVTCNKIPSASGDWTTFCILEWRQIRSAQYLHASGTFSFVNIWLAWFIRNHYKEATQTVHTLSGDLTLLKTVLCLTDEDFYCFVAEERAYLHSIRQPPLRDQLSIRYVQVLDELEERKYVQSPSHFCLMPTTYVLGRNGIKHVELPMEPWAELPQVIWMRPWWQ